MQTTFILFVLMGAALAVDTASKCIQCDSLGGPPMIGEWTGQVPIPSSAYQWYCNPWYYYLNHPVYGPDPFDAPPGAIRVLVEVPAGSNAKPTYHIYDKQNEYGHFFFDRYMEMSTYPFNFGQVPRTNIPAMTLNGQKVGGDDEPLDMILLSAPLPRGTVVDVIVLGALYVVDEGHTWFDSKLPAEQDPKLLTIPVQNNLRTLFRNHDGPYTLAEVRRMFPTLLPMIEMFWGGYKTMTLNGERVSLIKFVRGPWNSPDHWGTEKEAMDLLYRFKV